MKVFSQLLAGGALVLATAFSAANATPISTTTHIEIWRGVVGSHVQATSATDPSSLSMTDIASFDYSGPIDFYIGGGNNSTQNVYGNFFNLASISGFSSSVYDLASFGTTVISNGKNLQSYMQLTGTYNFGTQSEVKVTHDDGASLYLDGSTIFQSGAWTGAKTDGPFSISGTHNFDIRYVEANGDPSVLKFDAASVPEPSSIAILSLGLLGMGGLASQRKRKAA